MNSTGLNIIKTLGCMTAVTFFTIYNTWDHYDYDYHWILGFLTFISGTVAKLAMRQPFVLFKGLTFQKLCLPGAFRPGDHHNKMLRPGLCVVHASPQYL